MCKLMHRGGLDNILHRSLNNIFLYSIVFVIVISTTYMYIYIYVDPSILIFVHCNIHSDAVI